MLRRVVVGVDGTDASARALDWAAATVGPDGAVHCVAAASPMIEFGVDVITGDPVGYLDFLERHLAGDWTRGIDDRVAECTVELREQSASVALPEAAVATGADAIVIGSHHHRALAGGLIGRTTRGLLRKLSTVLIVVPDGAHDGLGADRPVVVGVGHGEATEAAVWWASQLADDRDLSVGLVRVTGDAPVFQSNGLLDVLGYYLKPAEREHWSSTRPRTTCTGRAGELRSRGLGRHRGAGRAPCGAAGRGKPNGGPRRRGPALVGDQSRSPCVPAAALPARSCWRRHRCRPRGCGARPVT